MANKTISLTIPHQLGQEEARSRIQRAIADTRKTYAGKLTSVEEQWAGNQMSFRLTAMGQQIGGRVDVQPTQVRMEVEVPWMLAMLAGGFKKRVEEEGRKLLEDKR